MSFLFIRGHVEVFDENGKFLFSADTRREAMQEAMEYELEADPGLRRHPLPGLAAPARR